MFEKKPVKVKVDSESKLPYVLHFFPTVFDLLNRHRRAMWTPLLPARPESWCTGMEHP